MEKINELIKQQLSLFVQEITADKFGIVTITDVQTEKDLKSTMVYFSALDNEMANKIHNELKRHAFEIQHQLAKKMATRNVPKIYFKFDDSQEKINRVSELLENINKEK